MTHSGIRMQVSEFQIKLVYVHPRKWWQFWKPKFIPRWLAQTDLYEPIPVGAQVTLESHGDIWHAKINDNTVLTYPKTGYPQRYRGFGMHA